MKRKYFYLLVFIQVLIIVGMFTIQSLTMILGTSITLRANTVDPRDLLKGEYVSLNYDIGFIPFSYWKGEKEQTMDYKLRNEKVYVVLKKTKDVYTVDYVTDQKPKKNELYVRARLQYTGVNESNVNGFYLTYGIENYYVQEDTAYKYENKGQLFVKASVLNGNIMIENVHW